jgi:hypothetical protein
MLLYYLRFLVLKTLIKIHFIIYTTVFISKNTLKKYKLNQKCIVWFETNKGIKNDIDKIKIVNYTMIFQDHWFL